MLAVGLYAVLALAAFWPLLPAQSGRIMGCACGDPVQQVWFLRWLPFALAHGHNPLFTSFVNVPYGANLAENTLMPLLGLLMVPVTSTLGPVASLSLLAWLAYPVSAGAMYFVLRRWACPPFVAFVGGLLYGFSPYITAQGPVHVMLSFVPLPPLLIYLVVEIVVRQRGRPYRQGLLFGLLVVAQFLIEPEVLAIIAVMALIGTLILGAARPREVTRERVRYAARGLLCCAAVAAALLAYPLWALQFGPQRFPGPAFAVTNPWRSDLLGAVLPTHTQRFAPAALQRLGDAQAASSYWEVGGYLGAPLLVALIGFVIGLRRRRWLVLSALLAASAYVLSLGPRLVVAGHTTAVPMPFAVISRVPLLNNILPGRLSLAESLFVAVSVALILSALENEKQNFRHERSFRHAGVALVCVALVPLVPRWPTTTVATSTPAFFTGPDVRRVPAGSVALTYPYPTYPDDRAMLWQAESGMRFRLLGGYIQHRGPGGKMSELPPTLSPSDVEAFLLYADTGMSPPGLPITHEVSARLVSDARRFVSRNHVETIMAVPVGRHPKLAITLLTRAFGPPRSEGGVELWLGKGRP